MRRRRRAGVRPVRGLPRLLYVKAPAPDRDPRLADLLDRIKGEALASYRYFRTPAELGRLVRDDLAVRCGADWLLAASPVQLGILAVLQGRLDEARPLLDEALDQSLAARRTWLVTPSSGTSPWSAPRRPEPPR